MFVTLNMSTLTGYPFHPYIIIIILTNRSTIKSCHLQHNYDRNNDNNIYNYLDEIVRISEMNAYNFKQVSSAMFLLSLHFNRYTLRASLEELQHLYINIDISNICGKPEFLSGLSHPESSWEVVERHY